MRSNIPARRRLQCALGASALASLLLATAADGKVLKLSGGVEGDANAEVSMKVVKKNGKPKKVKGFKFTDLDHQCGATVREFDGAYPGKIKVSKIGITNMFTFFDLAMTPSGQPAPNDLNNLTVTGQMKRSARKVEGTVDSTINLAPVPPAVSNTCVTTTNRDYTARK